MAIPFFLLDTMKVCGMCFPKTDAKAMKRKYPRADWKTNTAYTGANTQQSNKHGILDERATATTCPLPTSSPAR